jgi:ferredoxin
MIKIIHYRAKCIGCGICYELQPNQWRMSKKDGKANLLKAVVKKEIHLITTMAPFRLSNFIAKSCPVNAIQVVAN